MTERSSVDRALRLGQYSALLIDPPWPERGGGKIKRGADRHYKLMSRAEILAAILRAPCFAPAADSHLYLCSTMSSLLDGLWVMDGLGFRYVTHAVWCKREEDGDERDSGIGQYFRGAHELVLFGVRGKGFAVRSEARDTPSVIYARTPRANGTRVHSRKPDELYDLVERRTTGARLEMFARTRRPGWDAWGNELDAPQSTDTTHEEP